MIKRVKGYKISKHTFASIFSIITWPFLWCSGLPAWRKRKPDQTNIHPMPYSYSSPSSEHPSTIRISFAKLSPANILSKFLRAILDTRKNIALSLLPKILDGQTIHVVDVGAADGTHPRWEVLGANLRLSLFEPDSEAYNRLLEVYSGDERIKCFHYALSEFRGDITLHIYEWPRASSIFSPNKEFTKRTFIANHFNVAASISVPSFPLSDILPDGEISIIKADIEGYELPVLRGAGNLLNTVICLELEVNFNPYIREGVPLFSNVELFLREKGFSLVTLSVHEPMHYLMPSSDYESRGFITSGDALFFRLPHNIVELILKGVWTNNRLALACTTYLVYGNFELAYELMRLAVKSAIIAEDDAIYRDVMECIRFYAGYDRLVSYRTIKSFAYRISGISESKTIDY